MTKENAGFIVEGVDLADGSRTTLHECDSSGAACQWLRGYVSREDAGGWPLVEAYDVRGEQAERIAFWEREEA